MDLDKLINSKINDLNNKINDRINNMVGSYSQSDKAPFGGKVRIDENDDGLYAIKRINGTLVSDYYDEIEYYTDSLAKVYSEDKEGLRIKDAVMFALKRSAPTVSISLWTSSDSI